MRNKWKRKSPRNAACAVHGIYHDASGICGGNR